jgi:acylphosphatase
VKQSRLYRVKGRVQGVGYRFFAEQAARDLALKGYVRNLPDGGVEVYATGDESSLDELRKQLQQGPLAARVDQVEEQEAPLKKFRNFSIEG